ncbi:MAG: TonB-dependent receptor [Candidatus Azobacteroides sp.]|nr:TonB-dependent receptor [Candidatus Azobacteroides sp.]
MKNQKQNQVKRNPFFHVSPVFRLLFMMLFGLLSPFCLFAQTSAVTGTVVDSDNEPLIGASVLVKGTSRGTMTDINGEFSVQAAPDEVLVFSYLGMQNKEITVGNQTNIQVTLSEDATIVLEEVVAIGYGVQRKGDITTAVSTVTSDAIAERPVIASAQALQGKAAGVQVVQASGKPGGDISVRIRGNTSLKANNAPLYIVDGVPMENIASVNPNDIASMNILKDASSAAIYGSRAANGVVLITTKKGSEGKTTVSLNAYLGFSNLGKQIEALNTKEYYDLMGELGIAVDRTNHNYTNWYKETYKTGMLQNYQLSLSGGTSDVRYYISGGYQGETGIVAPADFQRISFRSNLEAKLKPWLNLSSNISFSKTDRMNTPDNNGASRGGVILSVINTPPFLTVWDPENPGQYMPNPFEPRENPIGAASIYDRNRDYDFVGSLALDFSITSDLKFKSSFSFSLNNHQWDYFLDPLKTAYGRQNNGIGQIDRTTSYEWLNENILTYTKTFNEKHNFSALAGFTLQEQNWDNTYISRSDYIRGLLSTPKGIYFANQISWDSTNKLAESSMVSALGRLQYDYMSKYLLTVNFRSDASSKFAPGHRWGYFPSVSGGWRISAEPFFENLVDVVNDLKLRAGWGKTGNQSGVGDYDYLARYGLSQNTNTEDKPGPAYGSNPTMYNPELTWEKTTQTNLGLDFSFLNSRILLTAEAYYKKTTDLLLYFQLPSDLGVESPYRNAGEMTNKGLEFELNTKNIVKKDWNWDTQFNISFNRNKLTKMPTIQSDGYIETNGSNVITMREGFAMGTFWGYISEGVDPETGDIIYKDVNGDGYISPADRTVIGCAQPNFTYGMTNTINYKDFTLSFFFQGSQGNDIFNASRIDIEGMTNSNNQSKKVLERWQRPGMITSIPRATTSRDNIRTSTRFVEDGSYLRLKTLTLSYNVDTNWTRNIGISAASIYATANNLFTITKYSGFDPEVNQGGDSATVIGIDYGTYPQNRSFIFGLNVTF